MLWHVHLGQLQSSGRSKYAYRESPVGEEETLHSPYSLVANRSHYSASSKNWKIDKCVTVYPTYVNQRGCPLAIPHRNDETQVGVTTHTSCCTNTSCSRKVRAMDRFNTLTSQRSSTYSVGSADTLTEHDRANSTTLLEAFAEVRHLYISHQPFFFSSPYLSFVAYSG